MDRFSELIAIIEEQIDFFSEAVIVEQKKLDAAQKNRVTFVEDCMKKEQAMVLKLRGFDKKREEIQADLGFNGLSLQQIVERCDEEKKSQLLPLTSQLKTQVSLFRSISESANTAIEVNLHAIDKVIQYSKTGENEHQKKTFTSQTI